MFMRSFGPQSDAKSKLNLSPKAWTLKPTYQAQSPNFGRFLMAFLIDHAWEFMGFGSRSYRKEGFPAYWQVASDVDSDEIRKAVRTGTVISL